MKVVWFVFAIVIVVLLFVARKESSGRHDQDIQEITMGHIVYKSNLSAAPSQMLRASVEEDSVRLDTRESVTACQPHVVFTTFKCPKCDSLRQKIEDNTLHTWSKMNKVTFEVISNMATNEHGVPILGDMYTKMFQKCPDAQTYTYVNGDIMATSDFVETIEAVQSIGNFLMVGKRTNVPWSENHDAEHANFNFDSHFRRGALFRSDAQDYFTVTKNAIDWKTIPPFVVGRPGYDNWLVDHIYHNSKVALIDATKTISVIHQTDAEGNVAQGGKMVKSSSDREYNRLIGKGQWDHGRTGHAEWETERVDGKIVLKNRKSEKVFEAKNNKLVEFDRLTKQEKTSQYNSILRECGALCDIAVKQIKGKFFNKRSVVSDCDSLFSETLFSSKGHGQEKAPKKIPSDMLQGYTLNGAIPTKNWYFNQVYHGGTAKESVWSFEMVEAQKKQCSDGKLKGSYSVSETNALLDGLRHAPNLKGGRVLVIGSERPWVEACALAAGAKSVVTLEYGKITSQHPDVSAFTPEEFKKQYFAETLGTFDSIVTFSSVEHAGLGRYGDALNPWADVLEIARARCVTRTGGSLVIGVMYGNDELVWNAHRIYGPKRWPYLTTNWNHHYLGRGSQKIHVFVNGKQEVTPQITVKNNMIEIKDKCEGTTSSSIPHDKLGANEYLILVDGPELHAFVPEFTSDCIYSSILAFSTAGKYDIKIYKTRTKFEAIDETKPPHWPDLHYNVIYSKEHTFKASGSGSQYVWKAVRGGNYLSELHLPGKNREVKTRIMLDAVVPPQVMRNYKMNVRPLPSLQDKSILFAGDSHMRTAMLDMVKEQKMVDESYNIPFHTNHCVKNWCFQHNPMGSCITNPEKYDLIIWNFGQHPASGQGHYSFEKYRKSVDTAVQCATTFKHKILWMETPPLPMRNDDVIKNKFKDWRSFHRIKAFNKYATSAFQKIGVAILPYWKQMLPLVDKTSDDAHFSIRGAHRYFFDFFDFFLDKKAIMVNPVSPPTLPKYLRYRCSSGCGGWSDRWKGAVLTYILAKRSNRIFRMQWDTLPLTTVFEPNDIFESVSQSCSTLSWIDQQHPSLTLPEADCIELKANVIPKDLESEYPVAARELWNKLTLRKELLVQIALSPDNMRCAQIRNGKSKTFPDCPNCYGFKGDDKKAQKYEKDVFEWLGSGKNTHLWTDSSEQEQRWRSYNPLAFFVDGSIVHLDKNPTIEGLKRTVIQWALIAKCQHIAPFSGYIRAGLFLAPKAKVEPSYGGKLESITPKCSNYAPSQYIWEAEIESVDYSIQPVKQNGAKQNSPHAWNMDSNLFSALSKNHRIAYREIVSSYQQTSFDQKITTLGKDFSHQRVATIENAVCTTSGLIANSITCKLFRNAGCDINKNLNFGAARQDITPQYDKVITIAMPWGSGPWHFVGEALVGLAYVQNIERYKIHVSAKTKFVIEWLRVVGVQEHQIITGTIFAKTLLIPELGKCGNPAPQQIMWLQEKINSYLPDNQPNKHVLVVKRTKSRTQSNWADILNVAKRFSSNVVVHDDSHLLSVQQQLQNFRNAHTVIAPHGAGLLNIWASHPNTKVIEFMDTTNMNLCYARLAYILGLNYNAIEMKSSMNRVSEVLQQTQQHDNFILHVLTMNRAESLRRLLDSIEKADYAGDKVDIYIHIDKSDDNRACIKVAESFDFSHGDLTIEVAEQNNGLRNAWFRAWHPKENERAIILEDDIEVSPQWYFWLNKAWEAYGERDDLAGISLQRQTLVPQKPQKQMEIVNNHAPFLYRLVGSIGFSPHWKQWRAFLNWIDSVDTSTVNIKTPGLITSDWFDVLDKRHMWTQYFIWFCKQHDLYTLYVNLSGKKTLAAHMREKGEHYGRTEGRDFALAAEVEMNFPTVLVKYEWDGRAKTFDNIYQKMTAKAEVKCDINKANSKQTFDALGKMAKCKTLKKFASGDDEKHICMDDFDSNNCIIFSLGSNDQWDFEEAVFDATKCMVHTFDCTGDFTVPPRIKDRVTLHKTCIGNVLPYMPWDAVAEKYGVPDYLKMDIEGWEWSILKQIAKSKFKPKQVGVELHLCSYFMPNNTPGLPWVNTGLEAPYKIPEKTVYYKVDNPKQHIQKLITGLNAELFDRRDNPFCPHCSEIVLRFQSQTDVCLKGPAMGQTSNHMVSIFHAIPTQGILGLDKVWSEFYNQWFEPHERVQLYFDGTCQTTISPVDSFYSEKTESRFNKKVWPLIKLKHTLLQKASEILASYDGPIATVHGRWLDGTCVERAETLNNFCTHKKENWKETCHYTQDSISKLLPEKIKHVVYMSDGQKPEYANTFQNVDHHPFGVQFAMIVESEYHFGNPMSSIDYIVSKMRENKPTYPEQCFAGRLPIAKTDKMSAAATDHSKTDYIQKGKIMQSKNGFVNIQLLNHGFVNMTKSWICNVRSFPGVLEKTLFITVDQHAYEQLLNFDSKLNVVLELYETPKDLSYGQYAYYDFMLFRTKLLMRLLQNRITLWLTESDAVWLEDPTNQFIQAKGDMILVSDRAPGDSKLVSGGFLLMHPTKSTLSIWAKLLAKIQNVMSNSVQGSHMGDHGSEQLMLQKLLSRETSLKITWLNEMFFAPGLYYKNPNQFPKVKVIQFNWIIGNDAKIKRAKKWGHWYLNKDGQCRTKTANASEVSPVKRDAQV